MKASENSQNILSTLPDELRLVPAEVVRREWSIPETNLWRLDKDQRLPRLRIGRRVYYTVATLKSFLTSPERRQPIAVPWTPQETAERTRVTRG